MTDFAHLNGSQPQMPTAVDVWPVPIAPQGSVMDLKVVEAVVTTEEGARQKKLLRLSVFTQGGSAIAFADPEQFLPILQAWVHLTKAAKAGLDLPPGVGN